MSHVTQTPLSRSKFQRSRSPGRFGWLFKSVHNLYGWHHILRYSPERAAACWPWGGGRVWRPPAYSLFIFKCLTCTFLMDVFHYNLNLLNIIRDCHSFFLHFLNINQKDLSCISTNLSLKQTELFSSHTVWVDDLLTDNCDISADSSLVLLESRSSVTYTQHTHC